MSERKSGLTLADKVKIVHLGFDLDLKLWDKVAFSFYLGYLPINVALFSALVGACAYYLDTGWVRFLTSVLEYTVMFCTGSVLTFYNMRRKFMDQLLDNRKKQTVFLDTMVDYIDE